MIEIIIGEKHMNLIKKLSMAGIVVPVVFVIVVLFNGCDNPSSSVETSVDSVVQKLAQ